MVRLILSFRFSVGGYAYTGNQYYGGLGEIRISDTIRYPATAIPEPATMSLLAVVALALFRRK